jgi:hypothetical protein
MIEIVIVSILSIATVAASVSIAYLLKSNKDLTSQLIQSGIANLDLKDELVRLRDEKELGENNDFVKFLSDSRDWAFEYIENVQNAIVNLEKALASGDEVEISKAYNVLLNYIPKDEKNN